MKEYEKRLNEIVEYAAKHVDFIGDISNCLLVPIKHNDCKVFFLEYAKESSDFNYLVTEAMNWLFQYSLVLHMYYFYCPTTNLCSAKA